MNFTILVPNVFYTDIKEALKVLLFSSGEDHGAVFIKNDVMGIRDFKQAEK